MANGMLMRMMVVAVAGAAAVVGGCELITGPDEVVGLVVGVEVPDTVQAGEEFTVTVRTSGSNTCWRRDRTEVSVRGLTATVIPYDVEDRDRGEVCGAAVIEITHTAVVTFDEPGSALVDVRGRNGTGVEAPVVVE